MRSQTAGCPRRDRCRTRRPSRSLKPPASSAAVRALLEVLVAPARVDRAGRRAARASGSVATMCRRRGAHPALAGGHQGGQRAVRGHDHVAARHRARRRAALTGRRHRPADRGALVDARAGLLGGAGERADPARRVQGAVVLGRGRRSRARVRSAGGSSSRSTSSAGEAVRPQRGHLAAHVLGLLLGGGHPQQPGARGPRRPTPSSAASA